MQQLRGVRSRQLTGVVLTPGVADGTYDTFLQDAGGALDREHGGSEYLRADGRNTLYANDMYDVELYDTTYFMPRFNNTSTQLTSCSIQNTRDLAGHR